MYIDKNCWNISLKFEFAAVMNCNSLVFLTPYLSIAKAASLLCQLPIFLVVFFKKKFVSLNSVAFLDFRIL